MGAGPVSTLGVAVMPAVALAWRRRQWLLPRMLGVGLFGVAVTTAGSNHWLAAIIADGPYLLAAALAWLGRSASSEHPSDRAAP